MNTPYILAIETSGQTGSVALLTDTVDDIVFLADGRRHSDDMIPMIQTVLTRNQMSIEDITGIAFSQGPGSFTGIRIACGLTQGIAYARGLPVVGIITLHAMAEKMRRQHDTNWVISALDARMDEIYLAAYHYNQDRWTIVLEPGLYSTNQLPPLPDAPWTGVGSGLKVDNHALVQQYNLSTVNETIEPDALTIAQLSRPDFEIGRTLNPKDAQPCYLRQKVALKTAEREALRHAKALQSLTAKDPIS